MGPVTKVDLPSLDASSNNVLEQDEFNAANGVSKKEASHTKNLPKPLTSPRANY